MCTGITLFSGRGRRDAFIDAQVVNLTQIHVRTRPPILSVRVFALNGAAAEGQTTTNIFSAGKVCISFYKFPGAGLKFSLA